MILLLSKWSAFRRRMIKSPAAGIPQKSFHVTVPAYPYRVLVCTGKTHTRVLFTETVIRRHSPRKLLSFDNWSYRPRHCCISIPNTVLPYPTTNRVNKSSSPNWHPFPPSTNVQWELKIMEVSSTFHSSKLLWQRLLISGYEICIGKWVVDSR